MYMYLHNHDSCIVKHIHIIIMLKDYIIMYKYMYNIKIYLYN